MSRVRLGGRSEALAHLNKAKEFLEAAQAALEAGWNNAASSNAVTAGINAKDALCFALAGASTASDDHTTAVKELRDVGGAARAVAVDLDRLLGVKDRAQYDRRDVTTADAKAALRRSERLVTAAEQVLIRR